MQTRRTLMNGIVLFAAIATTAPAQIDFDAGSDATFGAINVAADTTLTLDMPTDGVFHATTINVAMGATLAFNKNPLNTPVFLLATGDITIDGTINVSGSGPTTLPDLGGVGGPGGFDGGTPGFAEFVPPGAGLGPGAGGGGTLNFDQCEIPDGAGRGAYHARGQTRGNAASCGGRPRRVADGLVYGSDLLIPLAGGSGGGGTTGSPGTGGGGGGGGVLLASSTRITVSGLVISRGGDAPASGSGGAIRLVAPIIAGTGTLDVHGGLDTLSITTRGGNGRVRVDAIDRGNLRLTTAPAGILSLGSVLMIFPQPVQRLDIIEAAGDVFPEGQPTPVLVSLPFGSPTAHTVTVQARGFTGIVPIRVVLTPDTGDPVTFDTDIDMTFGDPATVVVMVDVPVNTLTRIMAWTR